MPYKILLVHNKYQYYGGEDVVVEEERRLLLSHNHPVEVYFRDNQEISDINNFSLAAQTLWSFRAQNDLNTLINRFRPDIIHAHNTFPLISPSLLWAAKRHNVPVVQTLHNFRLLCAQAMFLRDGHVCQDCLGRLPWRGIARKCYRGSTAASATLVATLALHRALRTYQTKVTRYIALNEFCRSKFIEGGLPPERIAVKPNFVATVDAPPENITRTGALFVGRLSQEKGIDVLRSTFEKLADIKITVAGDGPARTTLADCPTIALLGQIDAHEVLALMKRSSYLVMPSIWFENFPRTIVEAFACGLPVIASRLGAMADIIRDGITGLLFEPGSAEDLAEKITWAESRPGEMQHMGSNARKEYETRYTPEINYRQLVDIYEQALRETRNG